MSDRTLSRRGRSSWRQRPAIERGGHRPAGDKAAFACVETREFRHAHRGVEAADGPAVRDVGGEDDPLGGDSCEQLDDIQRREAGRVVEDVRMICEPVREHALIGKGGVCQDERHVRKAPREIREWIHPRHPAAGVDQDRDARIPGDGEDRFGGRIPEPEGLRARVQLDAAGSSGQAALRFADRIVGRVQSAVRNDPPAAVGGPGQHAIVGATIARAAVRVVKRERARPRTARGLVQKADQRLWAERLPILVARQGACARR